MAFCSSFARHLLPSIIRHERVPFRPFSAAQASDSTETKNTSLVHIAHQFEAIPRDERNKKTFMAAVAMFKDRKARNHVEFINTALKFIKEYNIHKDVDTYKALLDIFPKGKMIPQNTFQKLFLHFPMQQNCCVKVLDEMEWHGVQPDKEIHDIVVNAFGEWNFATKKIKRMLYWMPKLKHSNKYLDRRMIEGKDLPTYELAGLALRTMCRDPGTLFTLRQYRGEVSGTSAWIVSAQSPIQQSILSDLPDNSELFVKGPFQVYLMDKTVQYVTLTSNANNYSDLDFKQEEIEEDYSRWYSNWRQRRDVSSQSIHEQKHETILALASMHLNDNKTASVWLDELQKTNPRISSLMPRLQLDR